MGWGTWDPGLSEISGEARCWQVCLRRSPELACAHSSAVLTPRHGRVACLVMQAVSGLHLGCWSPAWEVLAGGQSEAPSGCPRALPGGKGQGHPLCKEASSPLAPPASPAPCICPYKVTGIHQWTAPSGLWAEGWGRGEYKELCGKLEMGHLCAKVKAGAPGKSRV